MIRVRMTKTDGTDTSSQHIGYWIEGMLYKDPEVGLSVVVMRQVRNGEQVFGVFRTSPVSKIEIFPNNIQKIYTTNSVWDLEVLGEV